MFPYLKFLLNSTNEHGVHSPFVFNYLTQCIYQKPQLSKNKIEDIILKSINYFEFENAVINGNSQLLSKIESQIPNLQQPGKTIDLFYFSSSRGVEIPFDRLQNDSMILIDGIHKTKADFLSWEKLIRSPKITVSIDFYYCGELFVRQEQYKEHFVLRA